VVRNARKRRAMLTNAHQCSIVLVVTGWFWRPVLCQLSYSPGSTLVPGNHPVLGGRRGEVSRPPSRNSTWGSTVIYRHNPRNMQHSGHSQDCVVPSLLGAILHAASEV
jgi:hypothetical protein